MNAAAQGVVPLSGRLTLDNATALFKQGLPLAKGNSELIIDLAQVEAVDSSAVSLMLVWLRAAQREKVKISFVNAPDSLRSLANLYGVAESLSLPVEA